MMSIYVVLSSNGSSRHENNTAERFTMDMDQSLEGAWEVALTEFTFIFSPLTLREKTGIYFTLLKQVPVSSRLQFIREPNHFTVRKYSRQYFPVYIFNLNNRLVLKHRHPIELQFKSIADAQAWGFKSIHVRSKSLRLKGHMISSEKLKFSDNMKTDVTVNWERTESKFHEYHTDLGILIGPEAVLCQVILLVAKLALKTFELNADGRISFTLHDKVTYFAFDELLARNLGFTKREFTPTGRPIVATYKPRLHGAFHRINILTDLTEPILVGGERKQILAFIDLDSDTFKTADEIAHVSIIKPMYIPLSSNVVQSISVWMQDEFWQPIKFLFGSTTHLTLHFRQRW